VLLYNSLVDINSNLIGFEPGSAGLNVTGDTLLLRFELPAGATATVPGGEQLFSLSFTALAPGNSDLTWNSLNYTILTGDNYNMLALFTQGEAVILPSPVVSVSGGGTFCEGDATTLEAIPGDDQDLSYQWSGPGSSVYQQNQVIDSLVQEQTGTYTLLAINTTNACRETQELELLVNPRPDISISETETLCADTPHLLDAGEGYESYTWEFDGNYASGSQSITVRDAGEYSVEVVNEFGCDSKSSVQLIPCTLELQMPNAFTPGNDDALNPVFKPVIAGDIQPAWFNMQIYNKWGEMVYESTDYNAGWDGTYKDQPAPAGIYVYVIYFQVPGYINSTLKSPTRGSVTLLR